MVEEAPSVPKEIEIRDRATRAIERYILKPEWDNLLKDFGYTPPDTQDLGKIIEAQKAFTNAHWDMRNLGGVKRERGATPDISVPKDKEEAVLETAKSLGMVDGSMPKDKDKHRIVVLGAGGTQAFYRALQAKESGVTSDIAVLTGDIEYTTGPIIKMRAEEDRNRFHRDERREAYDRQMLALDPTGMNKIPESVFMSAAAHAVWGEIQPDESFAIKAGYEEHDVAHNKDSVKLYHATGNDKKPDIIIIQAQNRDPENRKRANTADTYEALQDFLPPTATKLLVSTTGLFVPFQHLDAVRTFQGREVETIGFDTKLSSFHSRSKYLQEMNSMVNSASILYQTII
ncbi:MAG: hypothetical protein ACR2LN_02205 [Candidatus Levyibacteriota bacterium]